MEIFFYVYRLTQIDSFENSSNLNKLSFLFILIMQTDSERKSLMILCLPIQEYVTFYLGLFLVLWDIKWDNALKILSMVPGCCKCSILGDWQVFFFFFSICLWKISSTYKVEKIILMDLHVSITRFQQLSMCGQSYFMYTKTHLFLLDYVILFYFILF